jgi:rRNA small subunit pseudouridine methyltransferase Nep1
MLILGIIEAALELVPKEITGHPTVQVSAKARRKKPHHLLLDEAVHYHAMQTLTNREKRGRPDLVHRALLTVLDSILAQEQQLHLFLHTVNEQIIEVNITTRLPRRFSRFTGLMEQLFLNQRVPPEGLPLLQLRQSSLEAYIQHLQPSCTFLITEKGTPTIPQTFAQNLSEETRPLILVGGFAHGDFSLTTKALSDNHISLDPAPLSTSTIIGMLLHNLETVLQLSKKRQALDSNE